MKTKPKNIIQRLCLFLLVLVLAAPTWAQGNEITIGSKEDWKMFCNRVNRDETNLNVKLTRDVNLETDIVMVGNIINMYSGTFDGQGHTLKFNWNAGENDQIRPLPVCEGRHDQESAHPREDYDDGLAIVRNGFGGLWRHHHFQLRQRHGHHGR